MGAASKLLLVRVDRFMKCAAWCDTKDWSALLKEHIHF